MKWLAIVLSFALFLGLSQSALAVKVDDKGGFVQISTTLFELQWKKGAQMGYSSCKLRGKDGKLSDISIIGENQGRNLYHSSNYAGWKDWGAATKFEQVELAGGKAVLKFISFDGNQKEYTCIITVQDGAPWIKHEVTIKNILDVPVRSFTDGHDPMFEPRTPEVIEYKQWDKPLVHCAYFTKDNAFAALFTEVGRAETFLGWAPNGRMHLAHDIIAEDLKKKNDVSKPLVYYVAFGVDTGKGNDKGKDVNALAGKVTKPFVPEAVDPNGKLSTTWGEIKR